jgi:hypothetical protein
MPNVLRVAALQLRHPVPLLILMKPKDPAKHSPSTRPYPARDNELRLLF